MRKGAVFAFAALFILISLFGASRLIIDNVFIEYFKSDTDIAKSDRFIREHFGGSKIVSIVAEAPSSEILLSPPSLSAMDGLSAYLEARVPEAGKTTGFTDLVKRMNQVFNAGESPLGLSPGSSLPGGGEAAFGFGDEEPAFGFGDIPAAALPEAAEENAGVPLPNPGDQSYTLSEIAGFLDRALQSGGSRDMDVAELVRELKKLVNYEGAAYYEVPVDPAKYGKTGAEELARLVSNYLVLLSGDIDSYANDPLEPTAIKTTLQLRTLGESDTGRALDEINRFVKANFPPEIKVTIGGSALVESSLNRQVVQSQLISVLVSLVLVFVIIAFSNRSFTGGLVSIVPLSISILINFAVMGFLKIKLNIGTSMIASLAVGIGIDYTIHYMEAFKRGLWEMGIGSFADFRKDTSLLRVFLTKSFAVSGKAIIINAVSVGAGFAVLIFSRFNMLGDFGLLIALTMLTSALVSLTLVPALLLAFKPAFIFKNNNYGGIA
jgi:predicted RND superfamily exporter protein